MKKIVGITILFIVIFLNLSTSTKAADEDITDSQALEEVLPEENTKPTLFVREGCDHCRKVEEFIDKYNLGEKVEVKDVVHPEFAEEYSQNIEKLSVPEENQGYPILFDELEYVVGDNPIILHLGTRFAMEEEANEFIENYGKSRNVVLIILGTGLALAAAFLFISERRKK